MPGVLQDLVGADVVLSRRVVYEARCGDDRKLPTRMPGNNPADAIKTAYRNVQFLAQEHAVRLSRIWAVGTVFPMRSVLSLDYASPHTRSLPVGLLFRTSAHKPFSVK